MIIAMTGLTGFVGQRLARHALAEGAVVRGLARKPAQLPKDLLGGCAVIEGDLLDENNATLLLSGADVLVHLAALGVQSRDRDWRSVIRSNVAAPLAWLEQAARKGVSHVVATGTYFEYRGYGVLPDAPWTGPTEPPLLSEDDTTESFDAYAASKAASGLIIRAFARSINLPLWYLRLATLYGPGDDAAKILPAALEAVRSRSPFESSPGEQVREWLFVDDAIDALWKAIRIIPTDVAVINVGTSRGYPLHDTLRQLWLLSGGRPPDLRIGARAYRGREFHYQVMAGNEAARQLHWTATTTLETGLKALIDAGL